MSYRQEIAGDGFYWRTLYIRSYSKRRRKAAMLCFFLASSDDTLHFYKKIDSYLYSQSIYFMTF